MTIGGFILGILLMIVGFFMIWKTDFWLRTFGDLGHLVGLYNANWLGWKVAGLFFMFLGGMVAFGLFQAIIRMTLGRILLFGGV